jgi:probable HAF family extracellular repeat protein
MISKLSVCLVALTLVVALAKPACLTAQAVPGNSGHHHYKLIDMGTFGGPQSRIDYAVPLNNGGMVTGSADTAEANPYYGNDNPTFFPDPYIEHTFGWRNGVLTDLGSLPGGGVSLPNCMNERGDAAGNASNSVIDPIGGWPESRAVLYKNDQILDLGTLPGGNESAATCINNKDVVVGFASDTVPDPYSLSGWGTQTHAFRWTESEGMQDLGSLGGPDAIPFVVNGKGQITGFSYTNSIPNSTTGLPTLDPFLWENGSMKDLGGLGGTASDLSEGQDMNNRGQVVGNSNLPGDIYAHPFIWTKPGPMQDLGTLGGNYGSATRIDDNGEIVGWATTAGDQNSYAFYWKDQKMTNLGTVGGDSCSIAWFVRKGQAVGASSDCGPNYLHAFLWESGSIVDLNTLVPPGSGAQLTDADYINEGGEITASGVLPNGDNHAFLLIPCDENHPGIDGCDHSMVDASAATSFRPTPREVPGNILPLVHSHRNNRFLLPALGPAWHSQAKGENQ